MMCLNTLFFATRAGSKCFMFAGSEVFTLLRGRNLTVYFDQRFADFSDLHTTRI